MRKIITLIAFSLPLVLCGQNLVSNPGFEDATWDNGWKGNKATIALVTETAQVHSGVNACEVTVTDNKGGIRTNDIPGLTTGSYIGGAWIKANAGYEFKVQMAVTPSDGSKTQYLTNSITDISTGDWQHISVPFALEEGDKYKIVIQSFQASITFLVDDLSLIKASNIMNGNFEEGIDMYWSDIILKNDAEASINLETTTAAEGTNAMKIDIAKEGTSNSWGDVQSASSTLIPFEGAPKVISFYAKADVAEEAEAFGGIGFGYKNKYGKHQGGENNYGGSFALTNEYRNYKWAISASDYDTYVYANASFRCGPAVGSYFIDNISYEAYPGAPEITSTPIETGKQGVEFSYQATSSIDKLGKWKMSKPAGLNLSIDAYTGLVSGTPDTSGVFDIVVAIETGVDSIGQSFTLSIEKSLGVHSAHEQKIISVYPTSTTNNVFIDSKYPIQEIKIYSLSGNLVQSPLNFSGKIDVSDLPSGLYLLRTMVKNESYIHKFYKK